MSTIDDITQKEHFLSTVAIIRYQAKKDRRVAFMYMYPIFKQELAECKKNQVDLKNLDLSDIENYAKAIAQ